MKSVAVAAAHTTSLYSASYFCLLCIFFFNCKYTL